MTSKARTWIVAAAVWCVVAMAMLAPPLAAHADAGQSVMAPGQAAHRFEACGYAVGEARSATLELTHLTPWMVDVTSFVVRDSGEADAIDGRALTVSVFADQARAVMAHLDLQLRDEELQTRAITWSDDRGPSPGAGLGGSVWRGNVALAQLSAMLPSQDALGRTPRPRYHDVPRDQAPYAVDHDFVECLP